MTDSETPGLDGRVAVITGGLGGIGFAEARLFVEAGARVLLTDVADGSERVAELGPGAAYCQHDVSDPASWQRAVDTAVRLFGGIDILVNNAAIYTRRPLLEQDLQQFRQILDVNLVGPFLGMRAVAPTMRTRGGGAIVNVASLAGARAFPGHAAYGSSKWGLRGLSAVAAVELAPFGIRVNTLLPGPIVTPMLTDHTSTSDYGHVPVGRAGRPDEAARVVLFLASGASSYVNGAEVAVDGGLSVGSPSRG